MADLAHEENAAIKRDVADVAAPLTDWLRTLLGSDAELTELSSPESTGYSSETVLYTVAWTDGTGRRTAEHVLRSRPQHPVNVFPTYDLASQARCMQMVREHSDVPVPAIVAHERDRAVIGDEFLVMERVDGLVPDDNPPFTLMGWLHEADPADQQRLYVSSLAAMAGLHRLDALGLGFGFLDRPQHGPIGIRQQVDRWRAMLEWGRDGRPQPTIEAAFAWLDEHRPARTPPIGLNWGDARVSNIIFADYEPAALLDWEMADLGPAEVDLAWFVYMNRQFAEGLDTAPLPGFLDTDDTVALYSDLLQREIAELDWYQVFAGVRFSVTMMRIGLAVRHDGVVEPDSDVDRNNLATRFLARVLELPSPGEPGLLG